MSSSNCCFLTRLQVSQEAGKMNWHSHIFRKFPQFVVRTTIWQNRGTCASSPVRTPELQLAAEWPSTGECWIPHTHTKIPRIQSPNKMVGGAKLHLESNPIPTGEVWRAQTKPCVLQDPGAPQRLSQTCLWVHECLLCRHGSAVACCMDRGSGFSRPGSPQSLC